LKGNKQGKVGDLEVFELELVERLILGWLNVGAFGRAVSHMLHLKAPELLMKVQA
jgi:hypothetical protein